MLSTDVLRQKIAAISRQQKQSEATMEEKPTISEKDHKFVIPEYLEHFLRACSDSLFVYLDDMDICKLMESNIYPNNLKLLSKDQRQKKLQQSMKMNQLKARKIWRKEDYSQRFSYRLKISTMLETEIGTINHGFGKPETFDEKINSMAEIDIYKSQIIFVIIQYCFHCLRLRISNLTKLNFWHFIYNMKSNNEHKFKIISKTKAQPDIGNTSDTTQYNGTHMECEYWNAFDTESLNFHIYGPYITLNTLYTCCHKKSFAQFVGFTDQFCDQLYKTFLPPISNIKSWYLVEASLSSFESTTKKLNMIQDFVVIIGEIESYYDKQQSNLKNFVYFEGDVLQRVF